MNQTSVLIPRNLFSSTSRSLFFSPLFHPSKSSSFGSIFTQSIQGRSFASRAPSLMHGWKQTSATSIGVCSWNRSNRFHSSPLTYHQKSDISEDAKTVEISWEDNNGNELKRVEGKEGMHLLELAHLHDIDLEGACEASLACSTCHVILEEDVYDKLEEEEETQVGDEEGDLLDLAFGLTPTSRLGCQVRLNEDLDGARVRLSGATRNFAVDGFKPKPH